MKLLGLILTLFLAVTLQAKGVKAGTIITNQATLNFSVGNNLSFTIKSNEVKNIVSQVLNFVLEWQDTKPTEIYEGAINRVLNLSIVNEGNGKDEISISLSEDSTLSSLVKSMQVYADSNANGLLDQDDLEVTEISLEADEQKRLFVVTSLKNNLNTSATKLNIEVEAKSKLGGSGVKGQVHEGSGIDGVDAVDGINGGIFKKSVYYEFITQVPTFKKSVEFFDKEDYYLVTLSLDIKGNANLQNFLLTDTMPRGLVYRKNSIKFNDKYQSDKKDSDYASFDFNINRLSLKLSQVGLPKKILVTYILDKEVR